jgi:hypothetical protein
VVPIDSDAFELAFLVLLAAIATLSGPPNAIADPIQLSIMKPPRVSLHSFPDVVLHAAEIAVKKHPHYRLAKAGDILAADALVADMANTACMAPLQAQPSSLFQVLAGQYYLVVDDFVGQAGRSQISSDS